MRDLMFEHVAEHAGFGPVPGAMPVPVPGAAASGQSSRDHRRAQSISDRGVSVLVVFADAPEKRFLQWLKPGFRHCFVLISGVRAGEWICLDPQSHRVKCESWVYSPVFDPAAYYRGIGHHCIRADYPQRVAHKARFGPMSCVELVKRVLGISGFWIITPWQLYRHLQKRAESGDQIGNVFFSENCS